MICIWLCVPINATFLRAIAIWLRCNTFQSTCQAMDHKVGVYIHDAIRRSTSGMILCHANIPGHPERWVCNTRGSCERDKMNGVIQNDRPTLPLAGICSFGRTPIGLSLLDVLSKISARVKSPLNKSCDNQTSNVCMA